MALAQKLNFEAFEIHPIKIITSFARTSDPRGRALDRVYSLAFAAPLKQLKSPLWAGVEALDIKINCFSAHDVTASSASLIQCIATFYSQDLTRRWRELAGHAIGSMKALGKPEELYRNVGVGVKDFFYEVRSTRSIICDDKIVFS